MRSEQGRWRWRNQVTDTDRSRHTPKALLHHTVITLTAAYRALLRRPFTPSTNISTSISGRTIPTLELRCSTPQPGDHSSMTTKTGVTPVSPSTENAIRRKRDFCQRNIRSTANYAIRASRPSTPARDIADSVGAYFMVDMAHTAGLIATKCLSNPFHYADVVTSTTLRGPRSGVIFAKSDLVGQIDAAVFPALQDGPHNHQIAGASIDHIHFDSVKGEKEREKMLVISFPPHCHIITSSHRET